MLLADRGRDKNWIGALASERSTWATFFAETKLTKHHLL
jgi:hypothetical protein